MPFNPPFRTHYSKGDLVYGLSAPRAFWMMKFVPGFSTQVISSQPTIDVMEREIAKADQVSDWNAEFIEHLNEHPKYHWATSSRAIWQNANGQDEQQIRMKCKGGLNWACTVGYHVHFILDDIDMNTVIDKNFGTGRTQETKRHWTVTSIFGRGKQHQRLFDWRANKVRSVTGTELRWIYRHRFNPTVASHIQFWLNDKMCHAPWAPEMSGRPGFGPGEWSRYRPRHLYSTSAHLERPDPR